jgi:hypothetical protein
LEPDRPSVLLAVQVVLDVSGTKTELADGGASLPVYLVSVPVVLEVQPVQNLLQLTRTDNTAAPGVTRGRLDAQHESVLTVVEVLDFDEQAREKTYRVKIAAAVQPVPPEAVAGLPIRPVVLEGLTVTPYIADGPRPKIAYSLRCTGLATPGRRSADPGKAA